MTTTKRAAAHVTISYGICGVAVTAAIAIGEYLSHTALSPYMAGALMPVLTFVLAKGLDATGQVTVQGEPATVDATAGVQALADALLPQLTPAMQAVVRSEMTALLAPAAHAEAGPAPDANPAPAATTAA